MKKSLQTRLTKKLSSKRYLFILSIAVLGAIFLAVSQAASQYIVIEPEAGTRTGSVVPVNGDPTASNGSYIKFGTTTPSTSTGIPASDPITPRRTDRQKYLDMTGPRVPLTKYPSIQAISINSQADADKLAGKIVPVNVRIKANNITLRDVKIVTNAAFSLEVMNGITGFTLEYSEVDCTQIGGTNAAVYGGTYNTIRYNYIHGQCDGVKIASNTVYEYNLIEIQRVGDKHFDAMQLNGNSPGENITIRYNYVSGPNQPTGGGANSAVFFDTRYGGYYYSIVENNYLEGGTYTASTVGSDASKPGLLRNNRFGPRELAQYGWYRSADAPNNIVEVYGNVLDSNGTPLTGVTYPK